jgi:EAL domain-containing protein (putative c-di-GMP-specific phosphodiesterase class I)
MSAREVILLVDDDRTITEGLALLLERAGRTTIICADVETAEMMLARYDVTHLISDVQFSGAFGFEGLHFLARARKQNPECRIVLITGRASSELRANAMANGADALLAKPFTLEELEVALAVDGCEDDATEPHQTIHVPSLDEILNGDIVEMVYQPIVLLEGEHPFAFEALARVRGGWPAGSPADLFGYANKRGALSQLNLLTIERAIEGTKELPGNATLFINVDPSTFEQKALPRVIAAAAGRANFPLSRLVLEITERCALNPETIQPQLDELRAQGVRFALDDHGSAYSHLSLMNQVTPSFIKISQTFGTGLEQDPSKERIVAHIASLARDFGCRTVVEGVETADTARAAAALGIELAQGWHFGRPHAAPHWQHDQIYTDGSQLS